MHLKRLIQNAVLATSAVALPCAACAQAGSDVHTDARPQVRVTEEVDASRMMLVPGTHPAIVERATVGARLIASTRLTHMRLLLSASEQQGYAMQTLLDQQQDKTSANYHKWLTPETYAQHFGAAPADVAQITAWLRDQGFTVDSVAKGNRLITFSGTAAQVEQAFHTEMHRMTVGGEAHVSNTTDLQIPQAFAGVIHGVASLNDFFPKGDAVGARRAQYTVGSADVQESPLTGTGTSAPQYTSPTSGSHFVTPGDAAVIYNSTPLLKAGLDGTGQTVAVLGRTDITLSDVQQFRSMFGLKKNDPTFTTIGEDPGINTDDLEAYLDVEWAGGMAPGASVNFINGGSDYFTNSGISNAGVYAVDNNIGDIITLSYGGCETGTGASGTAFWNTLWEQAAAQGQTVFVSTGDSNATGCADPNGPYGNAYSVNALGSSAYNVAVGGSMFVDYGPNAYWTTGALAPVPAGYSFTTATGYMPEGVWNQGALTTTYLNSASTAPLTGNGVVGGGGGLSKYTARPAWQTGSGISAGADASCSSGTCIAAGSSISGPHRMVPDLSSIAASGHNPTAICAGGVCSNTSTGFGIGLVGGTSVATPVMASIQALINQKNGGRQGNANFYYYALANKDFTAGNCQATNGTASAPAVTLPASTCNFHDIVAGDNRSPQAAGDTTGLGFYAGSGYDAASGLGSVNITNVANNWSKVNFNATTTAFSLSPTTLATHGASQNFSVTVSSSGGTPTGDVAIIAQTALPGSIQRYTLTTGSVSGSLAGLPGGTYKVYASYGGDGTFAASNSTPVTVTIGTEASAIAVQLADFYPGHYQTSPTSIPYGYLVELLGQVAGTSSTGKPTGNLTFAVNQNGTPLPPLITTLDATATAGLLAGSGYSSLFLSPNYPPLTPASYSVTISYGGDASFQASSPVVVSFNVVPVMPSATLTTSSAYITSGSPVTLNLSLTGVALTPFLVANPSGTVVFMDTTSGASLGTSTVNGAGIASLSTSGIAVNGANTITAVYSGDSNYSAASGLTSVTVGALVPTTTSVAVNAGSYAVLSSVPLTATVTPAVAGTVSFYDGGVLLGAAATTATNGVVTLTTNALTAGSHTLQATFGGSSTSAASSGTANLTVGQNVTSTTINAPNYSSAGQTVSLNGRVARNPAPFSAGPVLLTGTVTFYDGATAITSGIPVYVLGGYNFYVATVATTALSRGVHTLTATYSGDANFAASASSSVTLTVTPDNVWIANTSGSVSGITATGTAVANPSGGGTGVAIDALGNVWSLNRSANSVAEFNSLGATVNSGYTGSGINAPSALAIDGFGTVWIANGNSTITALPAAAGSTVPATGYPTTTSTPSALVIDASGNLWITNSGDDSLTEVVGAAAPVSTPMTTAVTNNSLAIRP